MKSCRRFVFPFMLSIACIASACSKNHCRYGEKAVLGDASGLGCGVIIELSNGTYVEPTNLSDFSMEMTLGKKVWVSYHLSGAQGSVCMVGDIVVVDCISER